jgi:hypothetical protein
MKIFTLAALALLSAPAFANGLECTGKNIFVSLNAELTTLTVKTPRQEKEYAVIKTKSRTGETDQTFVTKERVNLTIDEQYGDRISIRGRIVPLECKEVRQGE